MKKIFNLILLTVFTLVLSGCVSMGQKLDYNKISMIQKHVTTEPEIRAMFGEPVTSEMNMKHGVKILTYGYKNSDEIKKGAASVGGAVAGGVLGAQIGGGTGQAIASGIGSLVGGFLANNAITAHKEEQYLEVTIGLQSHKVIDYNYIESKGRTQKIGFNGGVDPL